jgi:hypothetical protein
MGYGGERTNEAFPAGALLAELTHADTFLIPFPSLIGKRLSGEVQRYFRLEIFFVGPSVPSPAEGSRHK